VHPSATLDELGRLVLSGSAPGAGELAAKTVDERIDDLLGPWVSGVRGFWPRRARSPLAVRDRREVQ
jgi:hypothetical protein